MTWHQGEKQQQQQQSNETQKMPTAQFFLFFSLFNSMYIMFQSIFHPNFELCCLFLVVVVSPAREIATGGNLKRCSKYLSTKIDIYEDTSESGGCCCFSVLRIISWVRTFRYLSLPLSSRILTKNEVDKFMMMQFCIRDTIRAHYTATRHLTVQKSHSR